MQLDEGRISPALFREVVETLSQGALILAGDRVVYANSSARRLLWSQQGAGGEGPRGGTPETVYFGPLGGILGEKVLDSQLPWNRIAAGETITDVKLSCHDGMGVRRMLSFSGHPLRGSDLALLTVVEADSPYQGESFFRAAFEKGPIPMSLVRMSDSRVIDVNPALVELLGYERDDLVGKSTMQLGAGEAAAEFSRRGAGWDEQFHELVVRGKAREPLTLLVSYRPVEFDGEMCVLGIYQDMTEQRATEHRIREATQVVLQNAAEFSRGVVQQLERLRGPGRSASSYTEISLLTKRERDVITRVGAGHSNQRIAQELELTPQTVRNYVTRIYQKIGVGNRAEAVVWARERGLVES